jgi:hypothetical protein
VGDLVLYVGAIGFLVGVTALIFRLANSFGDPKPPAPTGKGPT